MCKQYRFILFDIEIILFERFTGVNLLPERISMSSCSFDFLKQLFSRNLVALIRKRNNIEWIFYQFFEMSTEYCLNKNKLHYWSFGMKKAPSFKKNLRKDYAINMRLLPHKYSKSGWSRIFNGIKYLSLSLARKTWTWIMSKNNKQSLKLEALHNSTSLPLARKSTTLQE